MADQELMVPASEYDALIDLLLASAAANGRWDIESQSDLIIHVRDELGLDASQRLALILDGERAREIFGT